MLVVVVAAGGGFVNAVGTVDEDLVVEVVVQASSFLLETAVADSDSGDDFHEDAKLDDGDKMVVTDVVAATRNDRRLVLNDVVDKNRMDWTAVGVDKR